MADNDSLIRNVLLVLLALLLLPILMMLVMMPVMGSAGWSHMWGNGMWHGTGAWLLLLLMIVPFLVLAGAGYVIYRSAVVSSSQQTDSAIDELRRAYARGDLTDEEFDHRREKLRGDE